MAAGLAIVALSLAACTGSQSPPEPSPTISTTAPTPTVTPILTPSPTPSSTPTHNPVEAAILHAYLGYWAAKVAAFSDPSKEPSAKLEKVAVDHAYSDVVSGIFTFRRNGIKVVGEPDLSPKVSKIVTGDGGTARIVDCVDGTDWQPIYVQTGKSAAVPGQESRLVTTSTAYYYGDHWTIRSSSVDRDAPC